MFLFNTLTTYHSNMIVSLIYITLYIVTLHSYKQIILTSISNKNCNKEQNGSIENQNQGMKRLRRNINDCDVMIKVLNN